MRLHSTKTDTAKNLYFHFRFFPLFIEVFKICQIDSKFVYCTLERFYEMSDPSCPTCPDKCYSIVIDKVVS